MHYVISALILMGALICVVFGVIAGVHETAYVGIALMFVCLVDAGIRAAFDRYDIYLEWLSEGAIKFKRW